MTARPPTALRPMLASAGALPRDAATWISEVKWDGVRALVHAGGGAELGVRSRTGQDLTPGFPELAGLGAALGEHEALLDGELIAFDDDGRQTFQAVQRRLRTTGPGAIARLARERPATLMVFDVLWLGGDDLTGLPWSERRARLEALPLEGGASWQLGPVHRGDPSELLAATAEQGLEGIVCKRADSRYETGRRSPHWRKIKHVRRQEVLIGGWTPGSGGRAKTLGALQVGVRDDSGVLRHAGGVGSGLREADLTALRKRLESRAVDATPFDGSQPPRGTRFARPELVCEVRFTGWTEDGHLRHPVFLGLLEDRDPRLVVREPDAVADAGGEPEGRAGGGAGSVTVDGRRVKVTNPDKPMWADGTTKADVIAYYVRIAPLMLPHLAGRAMTRQRFPHGAPGAHPGGGPQAAGQAFFEKRVPAGAPGWVRTLPMHVGSGPPIDAVAIDDAATLAWLANLAAIELHAPLALASEPERPTTLVFDLDPGAPADIVDCCRVGLEIRKLLNQLDLRSWAKTSGGKGLQLYAPLGGDVSFQQTKDFAQAVAALLEQRDPARITSRMAKQQRGGKVFVDWSQNDRHKTTVAVYSMRGRELPTVSTPVTWSEVETCADCGDPDLLRFTWRDVLKRADEHDDLFAPVHELRQDLPALGS